MTDPIKSEKNLICELRNKAEKLLEIAYELIQDANYLNGIDTRSSKISNENPH